GPGGTGRGDPAPTPEDPWGQGLPARGRPRPPAANQHPVGAGSPRRRWDSYFLGAGWASGGSRSLIAAPVLPLYSRTTPSWPPAATTAPSGLTPTANRKSLGAEKLRVLPPLSTFHSRTVWSPLQVQNCGVLPTNARAVTCLPWPAMVRTCSPLSK